MSHETLSGLSNWLCAEGLLTAKQAQTALHHAAQNGLSLTAFLVQKKILSSEALLRCCAKRAVIPLFDLQNFNTGWAKQTLVPAALICQYHVIPLQINAGYLQLGLSDPTQEAALSAIAFHTGFQVKPSLVDETLLQTLIATHYQPHYLRSHLETTLSHLKLQEPEETQNPVQEAPHQEPVSHFMEQLLKEALYKQASDIHLEPHQQQYRIRFRIDGILQLSTYIPSHLAKRVLTRLKLLSQMNIAEHRLPQDGRMSLSPDSPIHLRTSTCPTLAGEKMVLRLLDASRLPLALTELGLNTWQQDKLSQALATPQGLILVTGPTGSGKTSTLYAALNTLNTLEKNILTLEEPVEINLAGIHQVNVHPAIGLSFGTTLKHFLRQDPDIIMIGEIRDAETASIALQAAQTGHLVLATLHANHSLDTVQRLQSLGCDSHQIMSTVSLILAQRLVRCCCPFCKEKQSSCTAQCSGYRGRIGIFECLSVSSTASSARQKLSSSLFEQLKHGQPFMTLHEAGLEKVAAGITTHHELTRVLGPAPASLIQPN
ncbi:MAG: hypothetical protein A3E85_02535 [Gammaproteobacteria bacterium RIFCSPHIGHO2_12_FULL_45_12]|nr:MAG: hypothetical protein A3E85_02535 [Gammaproteobacteria bacterium RIFCSPHIGHO2_12_FULL_45_12]